MLTSLISFAALTSAPTFACTPSIAIDLQEKAGEPKMGTVRHNDKGDFDMVYIPAGEFLMGAEDNGWAWNFKPHQVTLSAYWISKTPVTVGQFRAFVKARDLPYDWHRNAPPGGWRDGDPMVFVSWNEAESFCRWAGGHLPTEAQWEHAARGPDDNYFPWGDTWEPKNLWISPVPGDKGIGLAPVDRTSHIYANAFGCTDMLGNVREWCFDFWGDRDINDRKPLTDPTGPTYSAYGGNLHCRRGLSWIDFTPLQEGTPAKKLTLLCAYQRGFESDVTASNILGFRFAQAARP